MDVCEYMPCTQITRIAAYVCLCKCDDRIFRMRTRYASVSSSSSATSLSPPYAACSEILSDVDTAYTAATALVK